MDSEQGTVSELTSYFSEYVTQTVSVSLVGMGYSSTGVVYGNPYDSNNAITGDSSRLFDMKFKTTTSGFLFSSGGPGVHEAFCIELTDNSDIIIHTTEPTIASEIFVQTIGFTSPYYEFFIQNNAGDYLKVIPQLLKDKSYKFKTYPGHDFMSGVHPFRLTVDSTNYDLNNDGDEFTITVPNVSSINYVCTAH